MKRGLVGLCGYAYSGKDTAAGGLVDEGWQRIGFADALKDVARAIGWDGQKDEAGRQLLQRLATEGVRENIHPDAWVMALRRRWEACAPRSVVIPDVRFPNEIEWIKSSGGLLIRVDRPGTAAINDHISEHAWADAQFDAVLHNDGSRMAALDELVRIVRNFE